jgi:hypothetical protein
VNVSVLFFRPSVSSLYFGTEHCTAERGNHANKQLGVKRTEVRYKQGQGRLSSVLLLGYVAIFVTSCSPHNITVGNPETKIPHDRPRHTRESNNNNITDVTRVLCADINCIQLALDRQTVVTEIIRNSPQPPKRKARIMFKNRSRFLHYPVSSFEYFQKSSGNSQSNI